LVDVTWIINSYDGTTPDTYNASGSFELPDGVIQTDPATDLVVNATVTVKEPHITEIDVNSEVESISVPFATTEVDAISQLTQQITIRDAADQTYVVSLVWAIDSYDGNTPNVYAANGTFDLPTGVIQTNPATDLVVSAMVTVENPYITDVDINNEVENISVPFATTENDAIALLVQQITIKDSGDRTHLVDLLWIVDAYDSNTVGVYNATGTFELPDDVNQSDPLTDEEPYITTVDVNNQVEDITVPFATTEIDAISQLVQQITIQDSGEQNHIVDLVWTIDSYDGNTPANYNASGTFELPDDVVQSDPETTLEVNAVITVQNPHITQVDVNNEVEDIYVAYGTLENDALSQLVQQITIKDSGDQNHIVNLTWTSDDYNGNTPGIYSAVGTFELPAGVDQSDPETDLFVNANITVGNPHITDVDVNNNVQDIIVTFGTTENDAISLLANQIRIQDSGDQIHLVALSWTIDSYDGNTAAVYNAIGTFELPAGVDQSDPETDLFVEATVTVNPESTEPVYINVVDVNNEVEDILVDFATEENDAINQLVQTIRINDTEGAIHIVNLAWTVDSYDGYIPGVYNATGTFELPANVQQSDPATDLFVSATITVDNNYIAEIDVNNEVENISVPFLTTENDAIAQLVQQITIKDSNDQLHIVDLNWTIDSYESITPDSYDAIGTFELPVGVFQTNPATALEVYAVVTLREAPVIVGIDIYEEVEDITVPFATSEIEAINQLVEEITISDSDGGEHVVILDWTVENYNGEISGQYNATGTFTIPFGVDQTDPATDLVVNAVITVEDEIIENPYIVEIDVNNDVVDITVPFATTENDAILQLAQQIVIMDSDDQTHTVDLMWTVDAYDGNAPVNYNATGTFTLPNGVEQSDPETDLVVNAIITVDNGVNVQDNQTDIVQIYPNPVSNNLFINNADSNTDFAIYDNLGRKIIEFSTNSNNHSVDVSNLKPGNYMLLSADKTVSFRFTVK